MILMVAMLLFLFMKYAVTSIVGTEATMVARNIESAQAFHIAESGVQYALEYFTTYGTYNWLGDWSGIPASTPYFDGLGEGNMLGGDFDVAVLNSGESTTFYLRSTGTMNARMRTVQVTVVQDGLGSFTLDDWQEI